MGQEDAFSAETFTAIRRDPTARWSSRMWQTRAGTLSRKARASQGGEAITEAEFDLSPFHGSYRRITVVNPAAAEPGATPTIPRRSTSENSRYAKFVGLKRCTL